MRHYQICKPMSGLDDFIKAADIFWMLGVWLYLLNLIDVYRWEKKLFWQVGPRYVCFWALLFQSNCFMQISNLLNKRRHRTALRSTL